MQFHRPNTPYAYRFTCLSHIPFLRFDCIYDVRQVRTSIVRKVQGRPSKRMAGGMGESHIPGDCLMWGAGDTASQMDLGRGDSSPPMQEASEPQLVWDSDHLDVRSVPFSLQQLLSESTEVFSRPSPAECMCLRLGDGTTRMTIRVTR